MIEKTMEKLLTASVSNRK